MLISSHHKNTAACTGTTTTITAYLLSKAAAKTTAAAPEAGAARCGTDSMENKPDETATSAPRCAVPGCLSTVTPSQRCPRCKEQGLVAGSYFCNVECGGAFASPGQSTSSGTRLKRLLHRRGAQVETTGRCRPPHRPSQELYCLPPHHLNLATPPMSIARPPLASLLHQLFRSGRRALSTSTSESWLLR